MLNRLFAPPSDPAVDDALADCAAAADEAGVYIPRCCTRLATVIVPLYGDTGPVGFGLGLIRGARLKALRKAGWRRRRLVMMENPAATAKESWTAAGANDVNATVSTGKPYISALRRP